MLYNHPKNGFTLIEMMAVIGILTVISTMSVMNLHNSANKTAVKEAQTIILTELYKARNEAINGYADKNIGVHLEPDKVVLFQGDIYVSAGTTSTLPKTTVADSTAQDIVFNRLTGTTTKYFSITIAGPQNTNTVIGVSAQGIISSSN